MRTRNDCALTHMGNVRSNNEDAFIADPAHGLWVVADGMGGHEAGEVASAIVIKTISDCITRGQDLASAIQEAHHNILDGSRKGKGARGMGSTVVAVHSTETHYQIGWVGDSRAYLWTIDNQQLELLSTDHSYVQMLVRAGAITAEEASYHPDKNVITQCLGSIDLVNVKVDTLDREWQENQWLLLCSDGLTDELADSRISAILANCKNITEAANTLLSEALSAGGRDNTTVIVLGKPAANTSGWQALCNWFRG